MTEDERKALKAWEAALAQAGADAFQAAWNAGNRNVTAWEARRDALKAWRARNPRPCFY